MRSTLLTKCHLDSEFWGHLGWVGSRTKQGLLSQASQSMTRAISEHISSHCPIFLHVSWECVIVSL